MCSTSTLFVTNSPEKVSQKEVIDAGTSDHQLVYCIFLKLKELSITFIIKIKFDI